MRQISTLALPEDSDEDMDGVFDDVDNCVLRANLSQIDADGDGIVNFADLGIFRRMFD